MEWRWKIRSNREAYRNADKIYETARRKRLTLLRDLHRMKDYSKRLTSKFSTVPKEETINPRSGLKIYHITDDG